MKKSLKVTLLSLCGIVAVLLAAILVFVGIYFTRIQTMNSIEKLSDYDDGYNLYRMEVKYDYSLDDVINYGIKDNQTMIDAILKDALPLLPVKIEAPSFGCTAFTLTDADGDVHMGRNYDSVLEVFDQQKDSPSNDTVWAALKAASQEPNPESITSNTQWSIAYNNADLTAEIIIRRHWGDMTRYSLTAGAAK